MDVGTGDAVGDAAGVQRRDDPIVHVKAIAVAVFVAVGGIAAPRSVETTVVGRLGLPTAAALGVPVLDEGSVAGAVFCRNTNVRPRATARVRAASEVVTGDRVVTVTEAVFDAVEVPVLTPVVDIE